MSLCQLYIGTLQCTVHYTVNSSEHHALQIFSVILLSLPPVQCPEHYTEEFIIHYMCFVLYTIRRKYHNCWLNLLILSGTHPFV